MKILKYALKVAKRITLIANDVVREFIYTRHSSGLSLAGNNKISEEDNRFIRLNQQYWDIASNSGDGIILIEGFFAASGHNYLLRTGMLAKAIQEKLSLRIAVLFDKPFYKQVIEKKKYESFGINQFFCIKPSLSTLFSYCAATYLGLTYYFKLKSIEDFLSLHHDKILFGDLIYDDLLKSGKFKYTIHRVDSSLLLRLIQALYYYFCYKKIFKKHQIKYLVSTHLVYAQYGLLARTALRHGVNVIETNDLMVNYLRANEYSNKLIAPTYHSVLKKNVKEYLESIKYKNDLIHYAELNLSSRISGQVEQFDAQFAYHNKVRLSKEAFGRKLKLPLSSRRSLVVIFAHIFSDAPHCSENILFRDYYHWLYETLRFVRGVTDVDWVIKPHPASKVYNELGVVEKMVNDLQEGSSNRNIFIFPEEVSAANLSDIADTVVTVQGTAGIEFSCLGLPVILAGKAFYAGQGFTYDPSSKEEYYSLLEGIAKIPKLRAEQVTHAKEIYAAFSHLISTKNKIISFEILNTIWGYGDSKSPDVSYGNKLINDSLEKNDPRLETQYLRIKEYLG